MANPKHLKILREVLSNGKSFKAWTDWKKQNPGVTPDFSGADLSHQEINELDLTGADLSETTLISAKLISGMLNGANLQDANLEDAYLFNAKLNKVNLHNVNFDYANLTGAELRGADLRRTSFIDAHLFGTILDGANLTNSTIGNTVIANVDLSTVKGLDSVSHAAPSSIGFDTLYRSQGRISDKFLRDAGVPAICLHCSQQPSQSSGIPVSSATALRIRNLLIGCTHGCGKQGCVFGLIAKT